jgi:hypothetical protein
MPKMPSSITNAKHPMVMRALWSFHIYNYFCAPLLGSSILQGSMGLIVCAGVSGAQNIDALLFMLKWVWCGYNKNRTGISFAGLVFLNPVGSVGHVVHSGASGA